MPELEICAECEEPTGRAGRYDDSIYREYTDGSGEAGPLCWECFKSLLEAGKIIDDE